MPQIPYLKNALLELSYIPAEEIQNPTPKSLYSWFLSHFSNSVKSSKKELDGNLEEHFEPEPAFQDKINMVHCYKQ
jgi:hypothetical protein